MKLIDAGTHTIASASRQTRISRGGRPAEGRAHCRIR
jgi:hypothetical protein